MRRAFDRAVIVDLGKEVDIDAVAIAVKRAVRAAAVRRARSGAVDVHACGIVALDQAVVRDGCGTVGTDAGTVLADDLAARIVRHRDVAAIACVDAMACTRNQAAIVVVDRAGGIIFEGNAVRTGGGAANRIDDANDAAVVDRSGAADLDDVRSLRFEDAARLVGDLRREGSRGVAKIKRLAGLGIDAPGVRERECSLVSAPAAACTASSSPLMAPVLLRVNFRLSEPLSKRIARPPLAVFSIVPLFWTTTSVVAAVTRTDCALAETDNFPPV